MQARGLLLEVLQHLQAVPGDLQSLLQPAIVGCDRCRRDGGMVGRVRRSRSRCRLRIGSRLRSRSFRSGGPGPGRQRRSFGRLLKMIGAAQ